MQNIDISVFLPPDEDAPFALVENFATTDPIKLEEANKLLENLNAEIDQEKLNETFKKLPDPKIILKTDDLVEGKEIVDKIQCNICLGIPIKPVECYDCNAIYCSDCMINYKKHTSYPRNQKCPRCR